MLNAAASALQRRLDAPGPKRILALDGGGLRGVLTLGFLEVIEARGVTETGRADYRLADQFDLIGGTSTGSIIATGLALGLSVKELTDLYFELGQGLFQKPPWAVGLLGAKFKHRRLDALLAGIIGDATLGSDTLQCGLAIVAKRLDTGSVWVFHNHPRGPYYSPPADDITATANRDLRLRRLIRASTAAPTFFQPEYLEVAKGVRGAFVDGGVSPHNNPALLLVMLASLKGYGFRWPLGAANLHVTSIGAGAFQANPSTSGLQRTPAAMLAVRSLISLMNDASWHNQAILQWMSNAKAPWRIDSEVGDLSDDLLGGEALIDYTRLDVTLERDWLDRELGMKLSAKKIKMLQRMDAPEAMALLLEIGRKAAAIQT